MGWVLLGLALLAGGFLALRLAYGRRWRRGLSCSLSFSADSALEGETVALAEVLENRKLLPLPVAEVDFHLDRRLRFPEGNNASVSDRTYRRDVFALGPRQRITRRLELECTGRGYFRLEEAGLLVKDLFLLQEFRTRFPQTAEFYILPRPAKPARVELPYARIMGALLSRKRILEDPFEFAGLREYARTDPMKSINWKATARAGRLLTNLHDSTLSQRVFLLLDGETGAHPQGELLTEEVIRLAAGLSRRLLAAGVELSLWSNAPDARTGAPWRLEKAEGLGSALPVQKALACLEPGWALDPVCRCLPSELPREPVMVLLTADAHPDLTREFSQAVGDGWGLQLFVCPRPARPPTPPKNLQFLWLD